MDSGSGKPPLSALDDGLGRPSGNLEDSLQSEIQSMLQEQRSRTIGSSRDMGLGINRSGSAPPTVEGSLNAVGGLYGRNHGQVGGWGVSYNNGIMSEEEIRSHPAYSSYYYSHEHLNPRLPPPPLSREDWRGAQRFQAGGSSLGPIGDWSRRTVPSGNDSSLFSMQPGSLVDKAENELMELRNFNGRGIPRQTSSGWLDRSPNDLTGLSGTGLGARRKSFADIVQEGVDRPSVLSDFSSRPASCNSFGHTGEELGLHNTSLEGFGSEGKLMHGFYSGARSSGGVRLGSSDATVHSGPSSVVSSLLRSTPELQNSSVPGLPSASSRVSLAERTCIDSNIQNSELTPLADIATNLSGLRLSDIRNKGRDNLGKNNPVTKLDSQPEFLIGRLSGQNQNLQQQLIDNCNYGSSVSMDYINQGIADESSTNLDASEMSYNGEFNIPRRTYSSVSLYSNANSLGSGSLERSNVSYNNANNSGLDLGANIDQERLNNIKNQARLKLQSSDMDTQYAHYPQGISDSSGHAIPGPSFASQFDNCYHTPPGDIALQRAYLETMLAHDRQQYTSDRYGSSHGFGTMYKRNSMPNIVLANAGLGSPIPQNKRLPHSMSRSFMGASIGSRHLETGSHGDGRMASSLLDEFKSNKTHSLGLSDIVDHVVEFSMDQYGSRFIQQKLETAMIEEKVKIFPEIIPHARTLMSDVFGNYVIQKFFEHGTESQRKELADQLRGHVLSLSLHMYGCRVIQKALEVVDVEQQIHMVTELDGSIIKCVYDQNGNHVIQKCIECVPQHRIQFIISTIYGQVVTLSTHPYGCRVIQRVLEHCDDLKTQQIIMDEIMQSVSLLAQDQYGNYVIQHVIEHGKPHERSAIINKLTGNIVKMSQQKFASNVVEKCLAFGSPDERQILVNEMLASDGCDPLPALMKDPFGNYVVQKVLETCNDQSLELLLSRIKDHLNNLKKYTYGKHIVSRIEKLILTGERRIGLSSSLSS